MTRDPKTHAQTVRFSQEEMAELKRISDEDDTPVAALIRAAVRLYIEARSKKSRK